MNNMNTASLEQAVNKPEAKATTNKWLVAVSVFTGAVMGTIDTFILYVATPHLRGIFSATISEISWVSTAYASSSLIFMLLSGWICQRFETKYVYQTMLTLFIGSSILCGMADTLNQLIIARIVQGASAGVLLPAENIILRRVFPKKEHGIVLGVYAATIMLGPSLGPLIGGFIIDNAHWSYIFFINVPIGIIGLVLAHFFVPRQNVKTDGPQPKADVFGLALLVVGLFSLIWLLERGERLDWFDDSINVLLAWLSVGALAMFWAHESKTPFPAVDLSVLKFRVFRVTVFLNTLLGFTITATLFVLPIYMQELLDFSPTKAGVAMAPRALCMMIFFPIVGFLIKRYDPKIFLYLGGIIGIYSMYLMSLFTHETGIHDMFLPQILQGLSTVLVLLPLTTIGLMSVSDEKLASASGFDSCARVLGGVLGIAVFASLITHFQEFTWGVFRENVTFSSTELYRRFIRVTQFWLDEGSSARHAARQGAILLYGRINEQIQAITYMRSFQFLMAIMAGILLIFMFSNVRKPKV